MPVSPNRLIDIINKNKNKKLVANKIIETNPKVLPILPKLIRDNSKISNIEENKIDINRTILESIHTRIKTLKNNNENIIKLFPDIELAIQILISSILSPKKMTDIQLNYKINKEFNTNPIVISNILEKIKTYINHNYQLEENLSDIIREALFKSGAYIYAIIPESSVDQVINSDISTSFSSENFNSKIDYIIDNITRPINILKIQDTTYSVEKINTDTNSFINYITSNNFVNILDNVNILKLPKIKETLTKKIVKQSLKSNTSISQESLDKIQYIDIFRQKNTSTAYKNIEFIKNKNETIRKSLGKPMVIKLPTESTIPVFMSGNEKDHIGYFVLLDESGKPLNIDTNPNNDYHQLNTLNQQNPNAQLSPVQKAYNNLITDVNKNIDINQLYLMYKNILEKKLYSSIKNSLYGSNVEIANKNEIYFMMFSRALADQKTNLLFIPSDLIVYIAFYYNELGIGKTLLENISVLSSLRAILLFSKIMALAKQSIDVTKVNISLDPNDPDPEKTIEQIQDSVLKLRQNYFPLGINNPVDLINWIQRAGLQFSYDNNPLLPNVKIDFENANLSHTVPDSNLEEELRKQTIIALGLSPETVDNGFSPEFATTVVNNNILLSKRINIYQKTLIKHLTKFVQLMIYNDEDLRSELKANITDNLDQLVSNLTEEEKQIYNKSKEEFIEYYITKISENIYLELPKPENTNLVNLSAEYDAYKENLDKVIESTISPEIFSENISGELTNHIETIRNIYKHYLLRKWCSDNNYYPEVLELSSNGEDIDNIIKVITNHLTSTMRNSDKLLKIMQDYKLAVNKDLEDINGQGAEVSTSESSSEEKSTSDDNIDNDISLDF